MSQKLTDDERIYLRRFLERARARPTSGADLDTTDETLRRGIEVRPAFLLYIMASVARVSGNKFENPIYKRNREICDRIIADPLMTELLQAAKDLSFLL